MLKHHKYRPYIRRLNGKEVARDMTTQIELAFYNKLINENDIKKAFVLTQRGFSNHVIAVSSSKRALIEKTLKSSKATPTIAMLQNWSKNIQSQLSSSSETNQPPEYINLN